MNVNDIGEVEMPEGDMLEAIFTRQKELIEKYGPIERRNGIAVPDYPVFRETHLGQDHLKRVIWWCVEEIGEAANCLKLKPWKQTHVETDWDHFDEELADALHFFVELFIARGLTARQVFELYFKKSAVNKFRQRSVY